MPTPVQNHFKYTKFVSKIKYVFKGEAIYHTTNSTGVPIPTILMRTTTPNRKKETENRGCNTEPDSA